jgi:hypothetical protein
VVTEGEDNDGWQEAGRGGGGGGIIVVQQQRLHNKVMENGGGRQVAVFIFLFLVGLNPTLHPNLMNPNINRG